MDANNETILERAVGSWIHSFSEPERSLEIASSIKRDFQESFFHEEVGWASLTAGWINASRGNLERAEALLAESLGRFLLINDEYGSALASSCLAVTQLDSRQLDRALELSLRAFAKPVKFRDNDTFFLHNNAARCHWAREEIHDAIPHLIKAHDAVKRTGDLDRQSVVVANIGALLDGMGEWSLSLGAAKEALRLHAASDNSSASRRTNYLVNIVFLSCRLEHFPEARKYADIAYALLIGTDEPGKWIGFLDMAEAYALSGVVDKAQSCLDRAQELYEGVRTDYSNAHFVLAEAAVEAARNNFQKSLELAKAVLKLPVETVRHQPHQIAAAIMSRAYEAMGRRSDALKWRQFIRENTRKGALGELLSSQLRSSFNIEPPYPALSGKELACLTLSAKGQTSADIGHKLGITARTVNFHFSNILRKLNAMNRQEAIAKAMTANIIHI